MHNAMKERSSASDATHSRHFPCNEENKNNENERNIICKSIPLLNDHALLHFATMLTETCRIVMQKRRKNTTMLKQQSHL